MDFHSLTRKELQALCKKNKIVANMTNVAMADALKALEIVEGLDEVANQYQSPEKTVERPPATASRASTRRKPTKEPRSTQPTTQTRRSTRRAIAEPNDDENKHINVAETPEMPTTSSRFRRVPEALAQCRLEAHEMETEGNKAIILETPTVQSVRKRAQVSSLRRKEKRQAEMSAQQFNSTRRSVRLLEKNLNNLSLKEKEIIQPKVLTIDQMAEDQVGKKDVESGTFDAQASTLLPENKRRDASDNVQHENPQGVDDVCVAESSIGNFAAVEIGFSPSCKPVDSLVCKSSDMEVSQLAITSQVSEPIQDENAASEVDVGDLSYEASARKDSATGQNRGLSNDEKQWGLETKNGKKDLMEGYGKSSNDSDDFAALNAKHVHLDEDPKGTCDAAFTEASSEVYSSEEDLEEEEKGYINGFTSVHLFDDSSERAPQLAITQEVQPILGEETICEVNVNYDIEILFAERDATVPQPAVAIEVFDPILGAVACEGVAENVECYESVRSASAAYLVVSDDQEETNQCPTFVKDQYDVLHDEGNVENDTLVEIHAMPAAESAEWPSPVIAHEQMNIDGKRSLTDMKNDDAEESSMTCNEGSLFDICGMLVEEPSEFPSSLIAREEKNIAVQRSMNDVTNNEVEESSMICNETYVDIYVMPAEEPARDQEEEDVAVENSVTGMKYNGTEESAEWISKNNFPRAVKEVDPSSPSVTRVAVPPVVAESECPQPTRSSSKKQPTIQKINQADHNKENISASGKKIENSELFNMSMRGLKKLIAEKLAKLDINDKAKNTAEDKVAGQVRTPLQKLFDNRMPGSEVQGN